MIEIMTAQKAVFVTEDRFGIRQRNIFRFCEYGF